MPVSSSWTEVAAFNEVEPAVNNTLHHLLDRMSCELQQGSGFVFRAILTLDINISTARLSSGSDAAKQTSKACDTSLTDQISQSTYGHRFEFDLSPFYRRKFRDKENTLLDVKNSKNRCFIFAIAAALYQHKFKTLSEKEDARNYKRLINDNFNIDGIKFPTPFEDVKKFVDQNEHLNINVNIYTVKGDELILVIPNISNEQKYGEKNVNLLALFPKLEFEENQTEMELGDAHFIVVNKIENLFGLIHLFGLKI